MIEIIEDYSVDFEWKYDDFNSSEIDRMITERQDWLFDNRIKYRLSVSQDCNGCSAIFYFDVIRRLTGYYNSKAGEDATLFKLFWDN
jgi:hypothetical protein